MQKINPRADLGTFTFLKNYARFLPEKRRRETPSEAIDRMMDMHDTKYARVEGIHRLTKDIRKALKDKKMLGSQRALQFGGGAMLRSEMRMFNCAYSFFDRPEFLSEAVWLLLCGCGTGFSVQKHHVAKLPRLQPPTEWTPEGFFPPHVVGDSIEGWADAFDVLLKSYIHGTVSVRFDYSKVRPEGAALSSSSAKAPGPKPLRDSLEAVRKLLDRVVADGGTIRPIDAYDIVMHAAMCVRAGGIRRSATIALFSPDDTEMATAKTGDWFSENSQRRLSNNSALLVRATASPHDFHRLMESTQSFGEPGFFFSNSTEHGTNPCQPAFAKVLTPDGIRSFGEVGIGDRIWSETGWTTIVNKWSTGIKPVFEYRTTSGVFVGTENHRIVQRGVKVEVKDAEAIDVLVGPGTPTREFHWQAIVDGLMCGDGSWHGASNKPYLIVGKSDLATYEDEFLLRRVRLEPSGICPGAHFVDTTMTKEDLPKLPVRGVPERYKTAPADVAASFLRGLFSANGSVVSDRVTLKVTSPRMRDDVQMMLSSLGIRSYFTTNKEHDVEFANGVYTCAESYDVNVTTDRATWCDLIGFLHQYKNDKIVIREGSGQRPKQSYDIAHRTALGEHEVFDITVDNEPHTYWTGGVNVSNCAEIGLDPVDERTGLTGWAMCNLTSVNVGGCRDEADFLDTCFLAAALGTLQAGYTSTGYLGATTKYILERDALLGVSLTGMADRPDLAFDAALLRAGVDVVKMANIVWAEKLGIRNAARLTTVKPEGSGSLSLEAGNGIHPHHHDRYLRYVEGGKPGDPLVEHIRKFVPEAVVQSAYNPDEVKILFPIDLGSHPQWLKRDTSAISHLEKVKLVQENWVLPGTRRGELTHNVSNTIQVGPDEWSQVEDFIWSNRATFGGVALLGATGDLDYVQAPFIEVLTPAEIRAKYGNDPARRRKSWEARRTWLKLMAAWQHIDWTSLTEADDLSGGLEIVACAGGACSF